MRWAAAETRSALPVAAVADLRLAGTVACAALGVLFCLLGGGFFLAGPKAALFVSGFGTLPPSERARYDTAALSRDYARRFLGWGILLLAGAGASALWSAWAALPALAVWQVLFWRQVRWDPERAFERYDLKQK